LGELREGGMLAESGEVRVALEVGNPASIA
jgi:hypothetical protein